MLGIVQGLGERPIMVCHVDDAVTVFQGQIQIFWVVWILDERGCCIARQLPGDARTGSAAMASELMGVSRKTGSCQLSLGLGLGEVKKKKDSPWFSRRYYRLPMVPWAK